LAISKERKEALVAQYRERLARSKGVILAAYAGLSVKEMDDLRRKIRELGGEFHVVQNRLAKLAFKEAGLPVPEEALVGTTAIGFMSEDVLAMAKVLVDAAKESEFLRVKSGVIDGVLYGPQQVERLAGLPPLPLLRAQLLGVLQAPASRVVGALAGSVRQLATVVRAYSEKGAGAGAAA
jgi:large subunit ribosomal protein L10